MERSEEGQAILSELKCLRKEVGKLQEKMSFINKVVDDRLAEMRGRLANEKRLISEVKLDTDKVNKSVKMLGSVISKLAHQLEEQDTSRAASPERKRRATGSEKTVDSTITKSTQQLEQDEQQVVKQQQKQKAVGHDTTKVASPARKRRLTTDSDMEREEEVLSLRP